MEMTRSALELGPVCERSYPLRESDRSGPSPWGVTIMKRIVLISALISLSLVAPLSAQDFESGMRAYRLKNYTTAVREWTPLARAGDAQA